MKKTLTTLFALAAAFAGLAQASLTSSQMTDAEKVSLQYSNSFDSATAEVGNITFTNAFSISNGVANIGNTHPYNSNFGDTFSSNCFTLSFDIVSYAACAQGYQTLVALYSNNTTNGYANSLVIRNNNGTGDAAQFVVATQNGGEAAYDGKTNATIDTGIKCGTANASANKTLTLVSDGTTLTLYMDGTLVGTISDMSETKLTGLQLGSAFGAVKALSTEMNIDNLNIWSRALTATEVAHIATPEPATATLSLLALAGLVARRRRK